MPPHDKCRVDRVPTSPTVRTIALQCLQGQNTKTTSRHVPHKQCRLPKVGKHASARTDRSRLPACPSESNMLGAKLLERALHWRSLREYIKKQPLKKRMQSPTCSPSARSTKELLMENQKGKPDNIYILTSAKHLVAEAAGASMTFLFWHQLICDQMHKTKGSTPGNCGC